MTDVLPRPAVDEPLGGPGPSAVPAASRAGRRVGRTWSPPSVPTLLGLAVAVASCLFVLTQLHPRLLVSNSTPAGGDMGAHVWGPAYLRDHLLPSGRISGWTPDWYAGFPAYQFYMVIPPLVIVALNAGVSPVIGVPLAIAVLSGGWEVARRRPTLRPWSLTLAVVVAMCLVHVPYGVAFKLVSVSGVVALPLAAWALGRLLRAPEPVPPFLALGTLPFLFDTNFTIYGGNIASTLAGEFSFSISLALALLAIGLVGRGMDSGRHRAVAAVVLALAALCHVIPAFFVVAACSLLVGLGPRVPRAWWVAWGGSLALLVVGFAPDAGSAGRTAALLQAAAVAGMLVVSHPDVRRRAGWLVTTGVIAILLAAFWVLPFVAREPYMNHMGWERLQAVGAAMLTTPMRVALPVAALGFVLALAQRQRLGVLLGSLALVSASTVANMPDTRLWNARVLPFFYLSVYLLAALTLALVAQLCASAVSEHATRPDRRVMLAAPVLGLAATLVAVGLPLRALPFGEVRADGSYQWTVFSSGTASFVPSWATWNYSGYEAKPDYAEYRGIVDTMSTLGEQRGCGRSSWEYDSTLNRYGTPMALMLLPFWTDGCIGSMEGLYFESSGTTPFHFLNSSILSQSPSRPQRDLPYVAFDSGQAFDLGVRQLQTMGVRYYLAMTDPLIASARAHPAMAEVAASPPWVVFEVAGSELVEPVRNLPIVVTGASVANAVEADRFRVGWLGEAVRLFNDVTAPADILPAESGPADWPRAQLVSDLDAVPVEPVTVTDIVEGTDRISFRVDRPGVPVLVKASYFPNWSVSGAEGPWRVGPNLMAVVPTSEQVVLSYGTTPVEWLAWALTAAGIAGVVLLSRRDRRRPNPGRPGRPDDDGPDQPLHRLPDPEVFVGSDPPAAVEVATVDRPTTVGSPTLSVVMPAFNEERDLEAAVTEVVTGLRRRSLDFELTVVENGSTDRTVEVARRLATAHPEVAVLSLPDPDYGAALRAGLLHARGEHVVNFDVDYLDLDFLDAALAQLRRPDGPAVVVGSKRGDGARDTRGRHRRLVTAAYVSVLRHGFGLSLSDTHGIKAMDRRPLARLALTCHHGRDLFDTELVLRAERAGLRTAEIPVTVIERRASRTSILRRLPRTLRGLVILHRTLHREDAMPATTSATPIPAIAVPDVRPSTAPRPSAVPAATRSAAAVAGSSASHDAAVRSRSAAGPLPTGTGAAAS